MKTINERWKQFAKRIPPGASEVQFREMKRAFFAGFIEAFETLGREVAALPDDEGMKQLESFDRELEGFLIAVRMGKA